MHLEILYNHIVEITVLSSAEAEFIVLSEASKFIVWLRRVLNEFGTNQGPTTIAPGNLKPCNGQEYIQQASFQNSSTFNSSRRDSRDEIQVRNFKSTDMQSDLLTNFLYYITFNQAIMKYGYF